MTANHIRVIVLVVAILLGVTIRFVWKGYKIPISSPSISSWDDEKKPYIRIPKPASLPTTPKAYSPPKDPVVVTFTPIQTPDTMLKRLGPSVVRIVANDANGEP